MPDTPLVSICIPVYNGEKFIDETIQCCLNQTHRNIEVIISDNCSTDSTLDRIRSYNDPRIKIFSNAKNEGLAANFKKVFTYATGKYMTFLGADDGMELDAMEKAVKIMEAPEHQDIVLVNTFVRIIDDESKSVIVKKFILGGGKFSSYWAVRANFLYGSNSIGEPNGSLFRKAAYDKIPEPRLKNANMWTIDLDLKFELLFHGNAYVIPEPLGQFRLSSQSTSTTVKFTQAKMFREYAYTIFRDNRYHLSFFWVITATVNSFLLQLARNLFYVFFVKKKKT